MRCHNPVAIPRNHKVEEALTAAVEREDLGVLERLLAVLAQPYEHVQPPPEEYLAGSPSGDYQTFCGT